MSRIAVGKSEHGRGVFALQRIHEGELIETCETLPTDGENDLNEWMYESYDQTAGLIALGFGSLYNHSLEPNAYFVVSEDNKVRIWASKPIQAGTEIRFNYNGDPENKTEWDFTT